MKNFSGLFLIGVLLFANGVQAFQVNVQSVTLTRILLDPRLKDCQQEWQALGNPAIGRIEKTLVGDHQESYTIRAVLLDKHGAVTGSAKMYVNTAYQKGSKWGEASKISCHVESKLL